ncbi:putative pectinesterase [Lupinus albus]|uniref:pectinesterase n=1 Tax=Lupinus albus TaxID=3870 RepID=A0A6A4NNR9_LUPAL|nr:putative pectinesterase [Lupinus albus]
MFGGKSNKCSFFESKQKSSRDCKIYFSNGLAEPRDGVITANERNSLEDPSAFVFKNCTFDGTKGIKTNLGRALESGNPRVIISDSYLADIIRPEGWNEVEHFVGSEGNITFVEVGCRGAGSNMSGRVPWINKLSDYEINRLLDLSFIDNEGWTSNFPIPILT